MPTRFIFGCAVSLDGFIADASGSVDWLNPFTGDYESDYLTRTDTLIMGRATYEHGVELGFRGDKRPVIVLSRTLSKAEYANEIWKGSVEALADRLRRDGMNDVWVMGGGVTASAFVEAGVLTDVRLSVMPVILGSGVPLFAPMRTPLSLKLVRSKSFPDGVITADYALL